jgi:hypothetical protein
MTSQWRVLANHQATFLVNGFNSQLAEHRMTRSTMCRQEHSDLDTIMVTAHAAKAKTATIDSRLADTLVAQREAQPSPHVATANGSCMISVYQQMSSP